MQRVCSPGSYQLGTDGSSSLIGWSAAQLGLCVFVYPGCPGERHADPPLHVRSGQIEFLVPKDALCPETYANMVFRFIFPFFRLLNFYFKFLGLIIFGEPDSETLTSDTP